MDNEVKEETRIVKLSLYLEKSILIILSKELGLIDFSKSHLPIIKWAMNYSLVCWEWFEILKKQADCTMIVNMEKSKFAQSHNPCEFSLINSNNRYRFHSNFENVKHLKFKLVNIKSFVDAISEYKDKGNILSIESILVVSKYYSPIRWDSLNLLNQIQIPNVQYHFDIQTECENNVQNNNEMSHKNFETKSLVLKSDIRLDCTDFSDFRDAVIILDPIDLVLQSFSCSDSYYPHFTMCHSISKHNSRYESVKIIDTPISLFTFYRLLQSPNIHTLHVDLQFHQIYSFYKSYDSYANSHHFDIEDEVEEDPNENIDLERIEYRRFSEKYYDELDEDEELDGTFDSLFCTFYYDEDITPNEEFSQDLWDKCQHLLMNHKTLTNLSICNNDNSCWGSCNKKPPKGFIHDFKVLINNLSPSIKTLGLVMNYLSAKHLNDILDNNQRLNEIILFGSYINTHVQPKLTQKSSRCYQFKPKLIKTTNDNIKITIHRDDLMVVYLN
ncbi:hypothetical protein DLAC_11555 [Tieghemostelium lacteum]|uniref:Uncharacterized protein n=1 Tax=Tieghemostelium lacteum TaxID=361077 RepID=A0A152A086_TIELA|nr:hypothetical protein DLAC_11555 [Tieghemostelium lacteum]|eukprot:KYQ99645.1 hypothetical protein DLAC_11555 [Tieghemostelium lacteum]